MKCIQGGITIVFSTKRAWKTGDIYLQKNEVGTSYLISHKKIKWITHLNIRGKRKDLLEENMGIDCYEPGSASGFLGLQSTSGKRKADELDL